jgi:hypothetical protein
VALDLKPSTYRTRPDPDQAVADATHPTSTRRRSACFAPTRNAAGLAGPGVVESFTRVTTFGEAQNHWVSLTADAHDPNVCTFERI